MQRFPNRQKSVGKRTDTKADVTWYVAMSPVEHRALNKDNEAKALLETAEKFQVGVRAKVEQLFRIIQTPIRIDQDSLPWPQQDHGAALHIVCTVQLMDRAEHTDGSRWIKEQRP